MLKDGVNCSWNDCDSSFVYSKHPRSAIARTKDNRVLFVTADGRFNDKAIGVSIPELSYLLKQMGAKDAINLDGGGSAILWMKGNIINHPSDNMVFDNCGERKVNNIICVLRNL